MEALTWQYLIFEERDVAGEGNHKRELREQSTRLPLTDLPIDHTPYRV